MVPMTAARGSSCSTVLLYVLLCMYFHVSHFSILLLFKGFPRETSKEGSSALLCRGTQGTKRTSKRRVAEFAEHGEG